MSLHQDRDWVVIVTGAGRGIGAEHARHMAQDGYQVVANDLGCEVDGSGSDPCVAHSIADEINSFGGRAVASSHDVSNYAQAADLVALALDAFGRLDGLVNNAGVVLDRMFVNMSPTEWDFALRMNLDSVFNLSRHAASHWRERSRGAAGHRARIVNTTSGAGLLGSVGQSNYVAAKAAIAALTINQAAELGRYGVTANAVAPIARTRLTQTVFAEMMDASRSDVDLMHPRSIAPVVSWLAGPDSGLVTGRVFEVGNGTTTLMDGWHRDVSVPLPVGAPTGEIGGAIAGLLSTARVQEPAYGV